jgi:2',3'-cyclic-nucleotide 2'-phosphodiesterase (5'-nucleotidase family)
MIACGNHEFYQGNEEGGSNEAANMHKYWTYNNSSGDELNYWFTVGNCMFVVYNTGQYGTLKPSQVAWINETLESYRNNYDWTFLVNHHPYYGCGQPSSNITTMIMDTIKKYNVSVSLTGHEHNYQRHHDSILNWTHIVSGGGGADLSDTCTQYPLNFSASLYHYMVWEVTGNSSYVQTFNLNNEIIDNFKLYI